MKRHDTFGSGWDEQFDKDWRKNERRFGRWFGVIVLVNIAWLALLAWGVIELVQWITSK